MKPKPTRWEQVRALNMSTFKNWTEAEIHAHNARVAGEKAVDERGWPVLKVSEGCADESKLHDAIIAECRHRGWICFHGSMAHRAMRTLGEPDFTILADRGRIFFIEAKTRTGKLSREQLGLQLWAENLGHKIHTVRSLADFLKAIETNAAKG